jgi:hypothetical protein
MAHDRSDAFARALGGRTPRRGVLRTAGALAGVPGWGALVETAEAGAGTRKKRRKKPRCRKRTQPCGRARRCCGRAGPVGCAGFIDKSERVVPNTV